MLSVSSLAADTNALSLSMWWHKIYVVSRAFFRAWFNNGRRKRRANVSANSAVANFVETRPSPTFVCIRKRTELHVFPLSWANWDFCADFKIFAKFLHVLGNKQFYLTRCIWVWTINVVVSLPVFPKKVEHNFASAPTFHTDIDAGFYKSNFSITLSKTFNEFIIVSYITVEGRGLESSTWITCVWAGVLRGVKKMLAGRKQSRCCTIITIIYYWN